MHIRASRRAVLATAALFLAWPMTVRAQTASGGPDAGLESRLDQAVTALLARHAVPGAGVAVAYKGRFILRKGYGMADIQAGKPVTGDTVFRVASISKPITAMTVLKLFEPELPAALERPVFGPKGLLPDAAYPAFAKPRDPRVLQITLRDLLQHSSGWKAGVYEPQYDLVTVAKAMNVQPPASASTVIAYMLRDRMLDVAPGTAFDYSNFAYNILGRMIEHKAGKPYAAAVQETVLRRAGAGGMMIAADSAEQRAPLETLYYDDPRWPPLPSQHGTGVTGPASYTDFHFPTMDGHGGWAGTPADLVRVALAMDGSGEVPALLKPATVQLMISVDPRFAQNHNGLGWVVTREDGVTSLGHSGALTTGTYGYLQHRSDGWTWAILLNRLPVSHPVSDKAIQELVQFQNEVQLGLLSAIIGKEARKAGALQTVPKAADK